LVSKVGCAILFFLISHTLERSSQWTRTNKNNKNRRGNRNLLGAGKLVAWALALTLVFYCTSSYMGSAGKQASTSTSSTAISSP